MIINLCTTTSTSCTKLGNIILLLQAIYMKGLIETIT